MKKPGPKPRRSFLHRGGVRVADTTLACDTSGAVNELVFLSHARVGRGTGRTPRGRSGRQQVLATDTTLALLGRAGEPLRRRALLAEYGRPFALGELRLELFPSGVLPGSASLLATVGGRRIVYAGPVRPGSPSPGADAAEVRAADALCIDARYGDPRYVFPPREEALAATARFVEEALAAGRAPVLLVAPFGPALEVGAALARRGVGLRAHRAVMSAATCYRAAKLSTPPVQRFAGKLEAGEALLWTVDGRDAPLLGTLPSPAFALVSGTALDEAVVAAHRVDAAIAFGETADFRELVELVITFGANEIALVGAPPGEALGALLRDRGHDAYDLGPARQMLLFG